MKATLDGLMRWSKETHEVALALRENEMLGKCVAAGLRAAVDVKIAASTDTKRSDVAQVVVPSPSATTPAAASSSPSAPSTVVVPSAAASSSPSAPVPSAAASSSGATVVTDTNAPWAAGTLVDSLWSDNGAWQNANHWRAGIIAARRAARRDEDDGGYQYEVLFEDGLRLDGVPQDAIRARSLSTKIGARPAYGDFEKALTSVRRLSILGEEAIAGEYFAKARAIFAMCASKLKEGDHIWFHRGARTFVRHRIVRMRRGYADNLVLQPDPLDAEDAAWAQAICAEVAPSDNAFRFKTPGGGTPLIAPLQWTPENNCNQDKWWSEIIAVPCVNKALPLATGVTERDVVRAILAAVGWETSHEILLI